MQNNKKTVLVSIGPTREYLDPVRFITNLSSGKLGYKIAKEFYRHKYKVIVVSGHVNVKTVSNIKTYNVETTSQMFAVVKKLFPKIDIFISAAAVCDFKPDRVFLHKVKKDENKSIIIKLIPTVDILEWCGKNKRKGQIVIGFALETDKKSAIVNAKDKMEKKNLDLIVLNFKDTLGSDFIKPIVIFKTGKIKKYKKMTKEKFAKILFNIVHYLGEKNG